MTCRPIYCGITEWEMYITAHDPVSEVTYTVSSGTLNSTIPYRTVALLTRHYYYTARQLAVCSVF